MQRVNKHGEVMHQLRVTLSDKKYKELLQASAKLGMSIPVGLRRAVGEGIKEMLKDIERERTGSWDI